MIVLVAALAFFWAPAMAMLSDVADSVGFDQGMAAGFINLAWAGGRLLGAGLGGAFADSLGDAFAYGALVGLCTATLATLLQEPRSRPRLPRSADRVHGLLGRRLLDQEQQPSPPR